MQTTNPINYHFDPLCFQKYEISGNETGQFDINLKNNGTRYCGHVIYKPHIGYGHKESENASFCVTLPGEDNHEHNINYSHT